MGLWEFIGTDGETFGGDWADYTQLDFQNPTYDPTNMDPDHVSAIPGLNDDTKDWILGGNSLPGICNPGLDPYVEPHRDDDNNGATADSNDQDLDPLTTDVQREWNWSFNRMAHCIYAIDQSGATSIVFDRKDIDPIPVDQGGLYDIEQSPRFGWVPESWRDLVGWLAGGSTAFEIKRFRPLFVNDLFFPQNASNMCVWRAGETGLPGNNGGIRFPNPAAGGTNPCTNSAAFNSLTALLFDVEFGGQPPTMLPQEVLDKEPALKKNPQPTLYK
jgi:hypothetical protein